MIKIIIILINTEVQCILSAMQGQVSRCDLTPSLNTYTYTQTVNDLKTIYGFEQIGQFRRNEKLQFSQGGFGVVLGIKQCAVKLIKDIKRCQELSNEIAIYQRISQRKPLTLIGRIPEFNLFAELSTFCHFNYERIQPPHSMWHTETNNEDDRKYRSGFVIGSEDDNYIFKDMKPKRGIYKISKSSVYSQPYRNLLQFYVNYFDKNLYDNTSPERGTVVGENKLISLLSRDKIREFCFAVGQLLSFIIIDCEVYPHDVEIVVGSSFEDRESKIYMFDFNECTFMNDSQYINFRAREAVRAMVAATFMI